MRDYYEKIIKESFSKEEVCKKLGIHSNGRGYRKVLEICKQYNIDILHFRHGGFKLRKYERVEKFCPICNNIFITRKGHKKEKFVCSKKCSNYYRGSKTEETKSKIRESLYEYRIKNGIFLKEKPCEFCKKLFKPKLKRRRFCCSVCSKKATPLNPSYIENLRTLAIERVKNGTHKGWKSREKFKDSYPESFFRTVLNNNNIKFEKEYPQGKWFIDFAILDKKIALEIDGKQHLQEDRKLSDQRKDEYLTSQGWIVHRIPWKNPIDIKNKFYIKSEIDKFLDIYHKHPVLA